MITRRYDGWQVVVLPVGENYHYLLVREGRAAVIDPGWAAPVLEALRALRLEATEVLVTHGDHDHLGGLDAVRRATGARVVAPGGAGVPLPDRVARDGDEIELLGLAVRVIDTPGHRPVHVAFHLAAPEPGILFSGDCLFTGGCGRLWGNPPALMYGSLCRLAALPPATHVYGGHEYTVPNLRFGLSVEPGNAAMRARLADAEQRTSRGEPCCPSTLELERETNIFLRAEEPEVAAALGLAGRPAVDVFAELRRRKDVF